MMRLLARPPDRRAATFGRSPHHPTMAQALWTTVRELRMAGVRAEALKPEAFSSPAKHAELVALLSAYERFLGEHNRGDMAAVYEEAVAASGLVPDSAAGLLDGAPGHQLEPAAAHAHRCDARRASSTARVRSSPACRCLAAGSRGRRSASHADVATNPLAFLMTPGIGAAIRVRQQDHRAVSRRRP